MKFIYISEKQNKSSDIYFIENVSCGIGYLLLRKMFNVLFILKHFYYMMFKFTNQSILCFAQGNQFF